MFEVNELFSGTNSIILFTNLITLIEKYIIVDHFMENTSIIGVCRAIFAIFTFKCRSSSIFQCSSKKIAVFSKAIGNFCALLNNLKIVQKRFSCASLTLMSTSSKCIRPFLMNKGKALDERIETLSLELAFSSCIHFNQSCVKLHPCEDVLVNNIGNFSLLNKQHHGGCKVNRTSVTCIIGPSTTESQKAFDVAQCINLVDGSLRCLTKSTQW